MILEIFPHRKVFILLILGLFLKSCSFSTCEETFVMGKNAIPLIKKYENIPPTATFDVPDSILMSSTKEIEPLLDSLAFAGFFQYQLIDSLFTIKHLSSNPIPGVDSTILYKYRLKWDSSLDNYIFKPSERKEVHSMSLLGRSYQDEEFHYNAITFIAGRINYYLTDSLYFKEDCKTTSFRYSYEIDSLTSLAKFTGFYSPGKEQRGTDTLKPNLSN